MFRGRAHYSFAGVTDDTAIAAPRRGYHRLQPRIRAALADAGCAAAVLAALVALFMPPNFDGAWLRLPALCALLVLCGAAWFVHRRREGAPPVLRGGMVVALAGVSLVAAANHQASGWASLAGGLGLLAAWTLRGSVERAQLKGRDLRDGRRKPLSVLFDQVESLASALVVVLLVWHFALEAFRIPSGSMAPTLSGDPVWGDRVFVDKVVYMFRDPVRWEPTVFRYPLRRSDPYVKRLIGLPGEELLIAQGDIYIRRHEGAEIELLAKVEPAREVLWLPLLGGLSSNSAYVGAFRSRGDAAFQGGAIRLGKGGAAIYPRGAADEPGNIVDHDASYGTTEADKRSYGLNVCGDVRVRLRIELDAGGELAVVIVRDGESFTLLLRPGEGACALTHRDETGAEHALGAEQLALVSLEAGRAVRVAFSFADGELHAAIDGARVSHRPGTPLLTALRARDRLKRIELSGLDAFKLATPDAGSKKARVEFRAGQAGGATVRLQGIERDVYYVGRRVPGPDPLAEKPFGVKLGPEQYFVLGDNSPGSKDARAWIRAILTLKDGTQLWGGLDDPHQEMAHMLGKAPAGSGGLSALNMLQRVAMLHESERPGEPDDATMVRQALEAFKTFADREGRGAVDFYTKGGGYSRVLISEIESIQVEPVPCVERKLFVGRPFMVFLSPRGLELIN